MNDEVSPKAWMSVTDADLIESILLASVRRAAPLRVLEWGSGRSTQYYTGFLDQQGLAYHWTSLEYDREFFESGLLPHFAAQGRAEVYSCYPDRGGPRLLRQGTGPGKITLVSFPHGRLSPFLPGHEADRSADLDDYVLHPRRLGWQFHVILVDGRKRRRCLLEAVDLLENDGLTILHDAQRLHYQCAFPAYASGRFVGDELWLGSRGETDFREHLALAPDSVRSFSHA